MACYIFRGPGRVESSRVVRDGPAGVFAAYLNELRFSNP